MGKMKTVKRAANGIARVKGNISEIDIQAGKVTFFSCQNCKITDLANIKFAAPDKILNMDISFNQINDLSLLENFPNLELLMCSGNDGLRDFSVLDKLPKLQTFYFSFVRFTEEEMKSVILPKTFRDTGLGTRFVKITNTENNEGK